MIVLLKTCTTGEIFVNICMKDIRDIFFPECGYDQGRYSEGREGKAGLIHEPPPPGLHFVENSGG